MNGYVTFKSILPYYGSPKQLIEKLVTSPDRALRILEEIAPGYMAQLEAMVERASPESERRAVWDTTASIRKLHSAALRFLRGYDTEDGGRSDSHDYGDSLH